MVQQGDKIRERNLLISEMIDRLPNNGPAHCFMSFLISSPSDSLYAYAICNSY
jgi:hypothetical protein